MGTNAKPTRGDTISVAEPTIRFDPAAIALFRYAAIDIDYDASPDFDEVTATFTYELVDGSGVGVVTCREAFVFPLSADGIPRPGSARRKAFERLVCHLGLAAGLSYYKMAAPPQVEISDSYIADGLTVEEVAFHRRLLAKGLGEFSFVNGLDAELQPRYAFRSAVAPAPLTGLDLGRGPMVPVGGGKDSCVSVEILRSAATGDPKFSPTLITVNRYPVIADVIRDANLPDVAVVRNLDPKIGALNKAGALNGHVPATAIVSLAALCSAVLRGHGSVVMSNERSASEGNITYQGVEINHQWSKSDEAELSIARLVQSITPELSYFSLLRPMSELAIARRFAETCDRYFDSFSSCNAAFRLDPARRTSRWCGQCPKCQFVHLALATALDRSRLESIWGSELFETSPEEGFAALLGLREWKPFECVGEYGECRVALQMVMENPAWSGHPVLSSLREQVVAAGGWPTPDDRTRVFTLEETFAPAEFATLIAASPRGRPAK